MRKAHRLVNVPYLGVHVTPKIGLSPIRIDGKHVYRALQSPNRHPPSIWRDHNALNDGGRTTATKTVHMPRYVLRARWGRYPIRDRNRPNSSASVLPFFPISSNTHVMPTFDRSTLSAHAHDLSILGPDEKRIPVVRKHKLANRLVLGSDKLSDKLEDATQYGYSRAVPDRVP